MKKLILTSLLFVFGWSLSYGKSAGDPKDPGGGDWVITPVKAKTGGTYWAFISPSGKPYQLVDKVTRKPFPGFDPYIDTPWVGSNGATVWLLQPTKNNITASKQPSIKIFIKSKRNLANKNFASFKNKYLPIEGEWTNDPDGANFILTDRLSNGKFWTLVQPNGYYRTFTTKSGSLQQGPNPALGLTIISSSGQTMELLDMAVRPNPKASLIKTVDKTIKKNNSTIKKIK
ncbi:MAG: hypothetical protein J6Y23_00880 [Prevotella sp.]|nr:hypothetical protein [Prevotella sp.]